MLFFHILILALASLASATECIACSASQLAGPCRAVTLIFARGSTEPGNIGIVVGPGLAHGLRKRYGSRNVAVQGVVYPAKIPGNYEAEGCEAVGITNFVSDLRRAAGKCPSTKIVAGGFSQGAACLHAAFKRIDQQTRDRVVGVVTFGDTRNHQDGGKVPSFPPDRTRIYCNKADEVCTGTLKTSAAHRAYFKDVGPAVKFLSERIGEVKGGTRGGKIGVDLLT
ncbi:hypothetical protein ANO11243_009560 [Dothideomycetidae sp. 11243]|nr:hypothetical protein ANO11243_009560 [fungal sp. No.11243]